MADNDQATNGLSRSEIASVVAIEVLAVGLASLASASS
jgi:hypothetical protein